MKERESPRSLWAISISFKVNVIVDERNALREVQVEFEKKEKKSKCI